MIGTRLGGVLALVIGVTGQVTLAVGIVWWIVATDEPRRTP